MTSFDVRIERRLAGVTPAEAWAAWTDPAGRAAWYGERPEWTVTAASDLRVGGAWHVAFGPFREEGVYEVVDPPNRLVTPVTFVHPSGSRFTTGLTVTFEAVGTGTLLTVVDAGFPDERTRDAHQAGWPSFLDRLADVIRTAAPAP